MDKVQEYIKDNQERFLNELSELIAIPSISAKKEHFPDMERCANHWAKHFINLGLEAKVYPTNGNPVVLAEYKYKLDAPTILVYGHYDVMPADPIEKWDSDPFKMEIRDGRIWARGADDDKGQSMIQVKGFETALKLGYVRANVKFLLEGEEEIGSTHLEDFCLQHKDELKADIILVSDTSMVSDEIPSLTTGLRGLAYWQLELTGPNRDLHSGHFGGAVANPINVLCSMMSKIVDENGRITIPEFYDDVLELSAEEKSMLMEVPFNEEKYKKAIDVEELAGEKGYTTLERNACRPSFDICGIWGGYTEEGSKTVLPSKAFAKVSCRLVANQDYNKITKDFEEYIQSLAPKSVKLKVIPSHGGAAYVCPIDIPEYRAAEKAVEKAFGKRPLAVRRGGSIPIIASFERVLGLKTILMGFGLESNAIHSPNENMRLDFFTKGIEAVAEFYRVYPNELN